MTARKWAFLFKQEVLGYQEVGSPQEVCLSLFLSSGVQAFRGQYSHQSPSG